MIYSLLRSLFLAVLILGLSLTACSVSVESTPTATIQLTEAYPSPIRNALPPDTGYPAATSIATVSPTYGPVVIPTPDSETGVIAGVLMDIADNSPIANQTIFLGDVIHPAVGTGFSIGIDLAKSPNTTTNQRGEFAIGGIIPGEYVVMVWTPYKSAVVLDTETNKPMIVDIQANQTNDIGSMKVVNPLTSQ